MARVECGAHLGLVVAAVFFLLLQLRLFAVQTKYADRIALAVDNENDCTRNKRALIDQFSYQQGKIVALEDENERLESKFAQLSVLIQEYRRLDGQKVDSVGGEVRTSVEHGPVAAVVIMACNRPDYLDRTLRSVLKYQEPVSKKFPLYVSQVIYLLTTFLNHIVLDNIIDFFFFIAEVPVVVRYVEVVAF